MEKNMKLTWLTQAGLLFESDKIKIMVDPYLSDSVGKTKEAKHRRIPADESFLDVDPDVIIITHSHLDHLDPETLEPLLAKATKPITFLAPEAAYNRLLEFGGPHNYVLLAPHSVWSQGGVTFYSVKAEHSDRTAAGFILDDGRKTYYVSGDTLYNYDVIDDVLDSINLCKAFTIITTKSEEIDKFILNELHHGATTYRPEGAFTGEEKQVIITVCRRTEALKLRRRVKEIDPHAFIIITKTSEIMGKGFRG